MKIELFTLNVDTAETIDTDLDDKILFVINSLNPELNVTNVETKIEKDYAEIKFYRDLKYYITGNVLIDIDLALLLGLDLKDLQPNIYNPTKMENYISKSLLLMPYCDSHFYGVEELAEEFYLSVRKAEGVGTLKFEKKDDCFKVMFYAQNKKKGRKVDDETKE